MSCLLVSLCTLAIAAAVELNSSAPVSIHAASQSNSVVLPASLVPAVAQTLAKHLPNGWQAARTSQGVRLTNPDQHLAMQLDNTGLRLTARSHDTIALQLISYTQGNQPIAINSGATPQLHGTRVSLTHGANLTEWYVNSPLGIEQGFTLARPHNNVSSVALIFRLRSSLTAALKGNGLEFQDRNGKPVLRYGDLLVYDNVHHSLPAHMSFADSRLTLHIDIRGARYPVTVDPLFSFITTLTPPGATTNHDYFGFTVALSGDGSTALIGNVEGGNVYVFTATSGVWSTMPVASFADPAPTTFDGFGSTVSLSADGSTALIAGGTGAPNYNGEVYVFTQTHGVWSTMPVASFADPAPTTFDGFGNSVSLSADGSTALIGADGNAPAGEVYVFTQTSGVWSTTPVASITDPLATGGGFGSTVSLSADGSTALIAVGTGAPNYNGEVYVFTQTNGVWSTMPVASFADPAPTTFDGFGNSVSLSADGTTALIGATPYHPTGDDAVTTPEAYVFTQTSGVWTTTPVASFAGPGFSLLFEQFNNTSISVSLSGDGSTALVGVVPVPTGDGLTTGEADLFTQTSGVWTTTPVASFADPVTTAYDGYLFGSSVSLSADGGTALVGDPSGNNSGTAYVFASPTDLSLTLVSDPVSVTVSENVTYMLTVTNNDTQVTASNLTLTDTLPTGLTLVSTAAAGGTCTNTAGTVSCTLASLAPQTTWKPSITVTATTAGAIKDTASVSGSTPDPNTANNSATVTTMVSNTASPPASSSGGGYGGGGGAFGGLMLMLLLGTWLLRRRV